MKSFFWKFVICLTPCLLAAWATTDATIKYYNGDSGGFKLGVDLVGGTILVYEIDLRKNTDTEKGQATFDPVRDINVLAESLKRRIDPNDLYNITIRPAGGEGRIEIILPTGGTYRTKKAEALWDDLLKKVKAEFVPEYPKELEVGRGKVLELADKVQTIQSEELWEKKLFSSPDGWERFKRNALQYWAKIDLEIVGDPTPNKELTAKFNAIKVGDVHAFTDFVLDALAKTEAATTKKTVQNWIKKQAWDETMTQVRREWFPVKTWDEATNYPSGSFVMVGTQMYRAESSNKNEKPAETPKSWTPLLAKAWDVAKDYPNGSFATVGSRMYRAEKDNKGKRPPEAGKEIWLPVQPVEYEPYQEDMERITPDSTDQLTTFVLTKGTIIGQAGLAVLDPLVGKYLDRVFTDDADPKADDVRKFITKNYGPPVKEITDYIKNLMKETSRDLSVEEVQRIKDLVAKVGSLEFSILANSSDDAIAIEDNIALFLKGDPEVTAELKLAQERGLPPPVVRELRGTDRKSKKYKIVTAHNVESWVSYRWVELGPQERRALNLDNAARTDAARSATWHAAKLTTRDKANRLPESAGGGDKFMLQGALFFSRECKDRNLPEDERRKKEVEYFVLTRDPEFESESSELRQPKITGDYLVSAYGAPGADLRPTVHFQFNNAGGNLFGAITRKNVSEDAGPQGTQRRRHLAIILDGMVMSAPTINSEIRTQGQISGNFTQKEVDSLVNILRAGRLPATLKPQPVSECTIAATLGEDTIASGVRAILLAYAAVLIFMVIYYRFAGIVASVALMANLLIMVGFMVAVQATFTLSGLAGIVLTLGMAVDANILIYERLREERERGASLLQAIRNGYDRALPTIIDTHVSSIFVAIVLYVVGNDNLKGFAVSMIVGLIISLFTSLYMTRAMFDYWQYKGWLTKLGMLRLFHKPDWDFMSIRYIMFGITLGLSILGAALFIGRLPNDLNIDFVGGTAYGGKLHSGLKVAELRPLVANDRQEEILGGVTAKEVEGSDSRRYDLTFPGDAKPVTVSLSNIPKGTTTSEREASVAKRASLLPEPSVELLFNSTTDQTLIEEMNDGKSRNFVIRTTEKEPEIVQACADRLLRDKNGKPLLDKIYARRDSFEKGETRLSFWKTKEEAEKKVDPDSKEKIDPTATASPSFVKSLFNRELRRVLALKDDKTQMPAGFLFEVVPEGLSDSDGKYKVMKIAFGPELKQEKYKDVEKALDETIKAFSARPLPDRLENFDSALANETRFRAMWAILASWAAMLMYLWFRFGNWTFGLAAVICLIHDLFFTLGAIAICYFVHGTVVGNALLLEDFKIDLPSVAALLTLVGYSCSDTIVVFDRIREVRGKNPDLTPKMLNDSVNQTLSRTILASTTVWLVVFVLYLMGGPGVHLFAFVMVVGVIVGTYSSIYIAAPLLLMFGEGKHEETTPTGAKLPTPAPSAEGAAV